MSQGRGEAARPRLTDVGEGAFAVCGVGRALVGLVLEHKVRRAFGLITLWGCSMKRDGGRKSAVNGGKYSGGKIGNANGSPIAG